MYVGGAAVLSGSAMVMLGSVRMDRGFSAVYVVVHLWWELVFAKGEQ